MFLLLEMLWFTSRFEKVIPYGLDIHIGTAAGLSRNIGSLSDGHTPNMAVYFVI